MAYQAAEVGAAALRQVRGQASFGFGTRQLDLDELVIRQRPIEGCDHRIADATPSDEDDGLPAVGQLAQMTPLGACQSLEGEGHGFAIVARPPSRHVREVEIGVLPEA